MTARGRALVALLLMAAAVSRLEGQSPAAPTSGPAAGTPTPAQGRAAATQGAAPARPATPAAPAPPGARGRGQGEPQPTVPAPQGFTYAPEGRRDPFVSLLGRAATQRPAIGARPSGLPGLAVDEVTLKGTMQGQSGYVAIVQGADNKTYLAHPGDKLLDGAVRTITQDTMVIMQQVNDPLSPVKQREVRKTIRQIEEAK